MRSNCRLCQKCAVAAAAKLPPSCCCHRAATKQLLPSRCCQAAAATALLPSCCCHRAIALSSPPLPPQSRRHAVASAAKLCRHCCRCRNQAAATKLTHRHHHNAATTMLPLRCCAAAAAAKLCTRHLPRSSVLATVSLLSPLSLFCLFDCCILIVTYVKNNVIVI